MPQRWDKHAFSWAYKIQFKSRLSDWNRGYWERKYWRRASAWVDSHAKYHEIGRRHYGRGWGTRYYDH